MGVWEKIFDKNRGVIHGPTREKFQLCAVIDPTAVAKISATMRAILNLVFIFCPKLKRCAAFLFNWPCRLYAGEQIWPTTLIYVSTI